MHLTPSAQVMLSVRIKGITRMEQEFTETGGVRYGRSFWLAWNFTIPFAHLRVTRDALILSVSVFGIWRRTFMFPRLAIRKLRWKRGIFSPGLQIEHALEQYPPFVLFLVGSRKALADGLRGFGYEVSD
jgi:hypothetical protein